MDNNLFNPDAENPENLIPDADAENIRETENESSELYGTENPGNYNEGNTGLIDAAEAGESRKTSAVRRNPFSSKKLRYGGLSLLFTLIFITAVILINVILNTVLERFDVEVDLTGNQLFSIEEETASYIAGLDDTINLYFTNSESAFNGAGFEYQQTSTIARRFNEANPNINISYVDLLLEPAFASKYGGDLDMVSIVVESEKTGRYKILKPTDYRVVKYFSPQDGSEISEEEASYYQMMGAPPAVDVSTAAEQAVLSAIMSVTNEAPVRVAFTSGFNEGYTAGSTTPLYTGLSDLLGTNAYVTETLDMILTDTIDPEIDFLIIFAPGADYSVDALTKIDKWLDNEGQFGKTVLYVGESYDYVETPNIDGFLADWGLKVEKDRIFQTNAEYASPQNGYLQYMNVNGESGYTENVTGTFYADAVSSVTQLFTESGNLITTPILSSYDGAILIPMDAGEDWPIDEAERGVYLGAAESQKVTYQGTTPYISRVIAFGSPFIFTPTYLEAQQLPNARLYMNIFNVISGKEEGVTITPKTLLLTTFQITADTVTMLAVIFAVVMPLIVIAAGVTVFIRRRYR